MHLTKKEKILLFGSSLWLLGEGMLGPFFALFTERIGGNILDISWAWAIYLIITGFFSVIIGQISDRINKAKIMIFGYALNAISTFGYLWVSNIDQLFIVQIGLGLSLALATPTWNALYADDEDPNHSGFVWGLADGDYRFVSGIAILLGGAIIYYFSFQTLFLTMGTIQTLAALYQLRILGYK
jgi:MFS family permease